MVHEESKAPQIQTPDDSIQKTVSQSQSINILEYKGIPYTKAPITENRFMPPPKPDSCVISYNAIEYERTRKVSILQVFFSLSNSSAWKNMNEGRLFLNVFVNEKSYYDHEFLPVMVIGAQFTEKPLSRV